MRISDWSSDVCSSELPVYGRGANVRDWLHVEDHARALDLVVSAGAVGESYNIGGREERTNLTVGEAICDLLDQRVPPDGGGTRRDLLRCSADPPGPDRRHDTTAPKIRAEGTG